MINLENCIYKTKFQRRKYKLMMCNVHFKFDQTSSFSMLHVIFSFSQKVDLFNSLQQRYIYV
jgi:hypothetical protein